MPFKKGHPSYLTEASREKLKKNSSRHWLGKKRIVISEKLGKESHLRIANRNPNCLVCESKLVRKNKEGLQHFAKRKTCGYECARKLKRAPNKNRGKPSKIKNEKHWNWKGGITSLNEKIRKSLEYKLWRTAVFERDNYACIWCGAKNGEGKAVTLNADHIKSFARHPELRFAIDNGRTLCLPCHKTTNTWGHKSRGQ